MNNLCVNILDKKIVVFLNNILIYSNIVEKYLELLKKVFTCLCKHIFYCMLKKCSDFQKTTTFHRFDITLEGMHISDAKEHDTTLVRYWILAYSIHTDYIIV